MSPKPLFRLIPLLALVAQSSFAASDAPPPFIEARGAKVVKTEKAPGGMTAYTVMKDGNLGVFFASPDKSVVMLGVMFDGKTGENLSDRLLPIDQQAAQRQAPFAPAVESGQAAVASNAAAVPNVQPQEASKINSQQVMEHLRTADKAVSDAKTMASYLNSDKVPGVTEGKAALDKTTFVFFDPLCPVCHDLFTNTRKAIKDGGRAIKWIPVNILGDHGLPLSNQILKEGAGSLAALNQGRLPGIALNGNERTVIDHNTAFMYMLSKKMGINVATPTILFNNPKSGKLAVAQGDASEQPMYQAAFGNK